MGSVCRPASLRGCLFERAAVETPVLGLAQRREVTLAGQKSWPSGLTLRPNVLVHWNLSIVASTLVHGWGRTQPAVQGPGGAPASL